MIRAALIWLCLALPLAAQELPDWEHTSINDFARLLNEDDTRRLDQALIALHAETGVQGTVVTLASRAQYGGSDGLEPFATRLFNHWGIGDAERNDGFMLLVLRDDREVRIELGAGYPPWADQIAGRIIDSTLLPAFRADEMSRGIRAGTLSVIDDIARPHAKGTPPDSRNPRRDLIDILLPIGVFGFFGFIGFRILRSIWERIRFGRRPCPNCGNSGLVKETEVIRQGTEHGRASEVMWTRCPTCSWTSPRSEPRPVKRRRSRRSSGFGGGRSSGGGASGRW